MNSRFGLIAALAVGIDVSMAQTMMPHYSSYSASSFDPVSSKITTTVTVQGNTTFNDSCTYCYSAYHTAKALNQISRQDTYAVIAGGLQIVGNVQPPSQQINGTSYVTFNPFDSDSGPGPWEFAAQGSVRCTVAGDIWIAAKIFTFFAIRDSSYVFLGLSGGRCSWSPTCTGTCSSAHTTNTVNGQCYSDNNYYKLCDDLLRDGQCWYPRAYCLGSIAPGPCT